MNLSAYENVLGFYLMCMRNYRMTFAEVDNMRLELLLDLLIVDVKINGEPQHYIDEFFGR